MTDIAAAHRALLERIRIGHGRAPTAQRQAAFNNDGLAEPVQTLLQKIVRAAHSVSDADVRNALDYGVSEDQLFELAVCAAVGQANRQYEAAIAALAQAGGEE